VPRLRSLVLPAFGVATFTWLACTVQYGVEPAGTPDAASDTPSIALDAGPDADAGEPLVKVPPRPTGEDGDGDLRLVFAAEWANAFPDADGGLTEATLGYDLDNVATCPGPESCVGATDLDLTAKCDSPGGRDNAFLRLMKSFGGQQFLGDLSSNLTNGQSGMLTVIENYNGGKNDRQVRAWSVLSNGTQALLADGGPDPTPTLTPPRPKADGTDIWSVSPDGLQGGGPATGTNCGDPSAPCRPAAPDEYAYVADGMLVARIDFPVSLASIGSNARMDIRSGYFVGRIVKTAQGLYRIEDGQIVGRIGAQDLLRVVGLARNPLNEDASVCEDEVALNLVKTSVCSFRDVSGDIAKDGMQQGCDAISTSIAFRAVQARMGSVSAIAREAGAACSPNINYKCVQ
jgi:hypothetical protein